MTPEAFRNKQRQLASAMRDGDYELAEGLAVELEPYLQIDEDDRAPQPIPVWETDK